MTTAFGAHDMTPELSALVHSRVGSATAVNPTIHGSDQMYRHSETVFNGDGRLAARHYFVSGMRIADLFRQVANWRFGGYDHVSSVLDFAAGYGRSTRFLVNEIPAERVWVAEILPDAVAFQQEQFGVHGLLSATDPNDFRPDRAFDCIFVSSLFSHLPERTFAAWLERLFGLLTPPGVLAFSVHDEAVLPPGWVMPDSGFLYQEQSENEVLDTQDYGSTFVTEVAVRKAIVRSTGRGAYCRIAKGLGRFQDVYLVVKDEDPNFATLAYDHGAQGWVDGVEVTPEGEVHLAGWAAHTSPGARVEDVQVLVDGQLMQRCLPSLHRPDIAAHLGEPTNELWARSGWRCWFQLPDRIEPAERVLLVKAVSSKGVEDVIHVGTVRAVHSIQSQNALTAAVNNAAGKATPVAPRVTLFVREAFSRRWGRSRPRQDGPPDRQDQRA